MYVRFFGSFVSQTSCPQDLLGGVGAPCSSSLAGPESDLIFIQEILGWILQELPSSELIKAHFSRWFSFSKGGIYSFPGGYPYSHNHGGEWVPPKGFFSLLLGHFPLPWSSMIMGRMPLVYLWCLLSGCSWRCFKPLGISIPTSTVVQLPRKMYLTWGDAIILSYNEN